MKTVFANLGKTNAKIFQLVSWIWMISLLKNGNHMKQFIKRSTEMFFFFNCLKSKRKTLNGVTEGGKMGFFIIIWIIIERWVTHNGSNKAAWALMIEWKTKKATWIIRLLLPQVIWNSCSVVSNFRKFVSTISAYKNLLIC